MKSKKAEIEFMLSDKMADVEVLRLFIPDGKDISFNGVIINVKDSADDYLIRSITLMISISMWGLRNT